MTSRTLRAETTAEAYLELLHDRGIEYFLGNAGTDFAPLVEAFARFEAEGRQAPRPLVIPHEFVAVSMAHGYYLGAGRPLTVMVHVTVGTGNASTALISASRANVPILMSAGRTPVTEEGLPGSRDLHIHWAQESFDQAAMLREYVKWDYELRTPVQLESVVDRALEMMLADPQGPVYLTLPREVLASRISPLTVTTPSRRQARSERFPDPARIDEAARILAHASSPLILVSASGRDARAVRGLVELAEAGGIGVVEADPIYLNFPHDHPLHLGYNQSGTVNPSLADADAILVIESDVPWYPKVQKPAASAPIMHLGVDPFFSRYPMRSFPCDVPIIATPAAALPLLAEAVRRHADASAVAARTARLTAEHRRRQRGVGRRGRRAGGTIHDRLCVGGTRDSGRDGRDHCGRERVPARSAICVVLAAGDVLRVAALERAGLRSGRRARREAGSAGGHRHRDRRRRRLLLQRAGVMPLRRARASPSAPHGHLQQPAVGSGEGIGARPVSRRPGQGHRPFPVERSDAVTALRGDREGRGRSRRASRAACGPAGRAQARIGRGARGPAGPAQRPVPAGCLSSTETAEGTR